jgi:hypothetical protein
VSVAAYYLGTLAAFRFGPIVELRDTPTVNGLHIDPDSLALGEVWENPKHKIALIVKNSSDDQVTIVDFATSCDCLAIEPEKLKIPPRGSARLAVTVDLTHRQPYQLGLAKWPVTVLLRPVFEKDFAPTAGWELKGIVRSWVSLEAAQLAFGDKCVRGGTPVVRKIRARTHTALDRLEASAAPQLATVRVEAAADEPGQYFILVSPPPHLPVGPFKFRVDVRAVSIDGVAHDCAAIDIAGEMQPSCRVLPRLILLGERTVPDEANADVTLWLPRRDWSIDRIETDSPSTSMSKTGTTSDGGIRFRLTQRIERVGDEVTQVRIVIRGAQTQTEVLSVEVRYHGQLPR